MDICEFIYVFHMFPSILAVPAPWYRLAGIPDQAKDETNDCMLSWWVALRLSLAEEGVFAEGVLRMMRIRREGYVRG